MGFSPIDYAVLIVYLVGITVFGTLFRKSHHTVKDYFVGARKTHWLVISLSIVATETSTLTLIGVPALAYTIYARPEQGGAFTYLQVVLGYIVARVIISLLFIPAYFQGEMLTAYALLARRFGETTKHFAASLFLTMRALAEGVRVFAASLVLAAVISSSLPGLPHLWLWSIVLVGLLTLIYTFEGGIAAVIWTDLIQLVIYIGGSLLAAWQLLHLVPGGWPTIAAHAEAAHKFEWLSFSWDLRLPFTFWAGPHRRHVPDDGLARHRSTARAAPAHLPQPAGQPEGAHHERLHRALPVRAVPDDRRDALRLLPARALAAHHDQRRDLPRLHRPQPAARDCRPGDRRRLRGRDVEPERVAQLAGLDDGARLLPAAGRRAAHRGAAPVALALVHGRLGPGAHRDRDRGARLGIGVHGGAVDRLARLRPDARGLPAGHPHPRTNQTGAVAGIGVSLVCMLLVKAYTPLAWTWYVLAGTLICIAVGYGTSVLFAGAGRRRP